MYRSPRSSQAEVGGQAPGQGEEAQGLLPSPWRRLQGQGQPSCWAGGGRGGAGPPPGGRGRGAPAPGTSGPPACAPWCPSPPWTCGRCCRPAAGSPAAPPPCPAACTGGDGLEDGLELLLRGLAGAAVDVLLLHQGHVVQGAHPDHEELVQVAGEDGGELQPLHQGDALVLGLLQHPLVEAQPGQLPVLGISGIYFFCHSFYSLSLMWMA